METAGWSSRLWQIANNPWGMKLPKVRQTTATNSINISGNEWAYYPTVQDAAKDIFLWMKARGFRQDITNLEDFIKEMKAKGYFEEPYNHYLNLVIAWMNR